MSTLAGTKGVSGYSNGIGTAAKFNFPEAITIDSSGNLYVSDAYNRRIRKITPDAKVTLVAGDGVEGFADSGARSLDMPKCRMAKALSPVVV